MAAGIAPPVGGAADEAADQAATLHERGVDTFFVAPRRSPRAQLSSIDLAFQLEQRADVETIATVTTWDKTIMALQADLLGANALGIRNVVCETGNPPLLGDYPNVDGIWDVDSVGLVELVAGLNKGIDCNGLPLATRTSFYAGARFNPSAAALESEIARTASKIQAGARFLISSPVYELGGLRRLMPSAGGGQLPVLLSIAALRSFEEADYLSHEVPDISIPQQTLTAMERAGSHAAETGMELAADLFVEARPLVQGVVLAFPGWDTAAWIACSGAVHEPVPGGSGERRLHGDRGGRPPRGAGTGAGDRKVSPLRGWWRRSTSPTTRAPRCGCPAGPGAWPSWPPAWSRSCSSPAVTGTGSRCSPPCSARRRWGYPTSW